MKAQIYKFSILLCQFVCGGLVMDLDYGFMKEFMVIVLPLSIVGGVLFALYDKEIKKNC